MSSVSALQYVHTTRMIVDKRKQEVVSVILRTFASA